MGRVLCRVLRNEIINHIAMSEIKYKICPKCGAIMKVREDIMTSSMPPMYVYDCPECKWLDFDVEKYPYTVQPEIKGAIVNYPPEPTEASYAVKFRNEAAKDILASLLTSNAVFKDNKGKVVKSSTDFVEYAIAIADELIQQLKKEN